MRKALLAAVIFLAASGCGRSLIGCYPRWNESRIQRLRLMQGVERLAVAPPELGSGVEKEELKYVPLLERALANRLMGLRRFRLVREDEFAAALKAAAGLTPDHALPKRWEEEVLLKAARSVEADAVLHIRMEDFDPYLTPKVVILARLYLARRPNLGEKSIIEMTDDGIPTGVPGSVRHEFIWQQDFVLDAHDARTLELVGSFARTQELKYHGFGPKIFVRSMERFLDFAAAVVAKRLFDDAEFYKTILLYEKRSGRHLGRENEEDESHLPFEYR